ncbi:MAG: hypothetical protein HOV79_03650 [Hamadaea sp.]|nr:hypothetical protein [Hamadaea sp.]
MQFPAAMIIARQLTEEHVGSARLDAPQIPDPPARGPRFEGARRVAASAQRGLATRVEPRRDTCQPAL